MGKANVLRVINLILGISFVVQMAVLIIMFFHIQIGNPKVVFQIHKNNGMFLMFCAFVHLVLNWGWVKASYLRKQ